MWPKFGHRGWATSPGWQLIECQDAVDRDLPLRRSFHAHLSTAACLAKAGLIGLWSHLDVPGFCSLLACSWHDSPSGRCCARADVLRPNMAGLLATCGMSPKDALTCGGSSHDFRRFTAAPAAMCPGVNRIAGPVERPSVVKAWLTVDLLLGSSFCGQSTAIETSDRCRVGSHVGGKTLLTTVRCATIRFMHLQLGDLATWVSSIVVVGTLVVALYQIRTERVRRHEDEQRAFQMSRRKQAERISAWPAQSPDDTHTQLTLLNRSDEPVYEVVIMLVMIQGAGPRRGEDVVDSSYRETLSTLPPGRWRAELRAGKARWAGMSRRPGVEIAFTDRSGVHWIRRSTGALEEIGRPAIDHYGMSRPQPFEFPQIDQ